MPLGMEVGLGAGNYLFDGTQLPQKKGHSPHPIFGPYLLWPNGWMDQDVTWYGGKARLRRRCVRWGRYKGHSPQFSVHVYCGQMAGRMKTLLGTEVDLVPGHFVIDGDPAPPRKGHSSPLFSAHAYCGHGRPSQLLLSTCKDSCHGRSWLRVQRP